MVYQVQLFLPVSAREAYQSYLDRNEVLRWEKGLTAVEDTIGRLFEVGAEGFLVFGNNKNPMKMKVIVEHLHEPNSCTLIYQVPGAWNKCVNTFVDSIDGCTWEMNVEFRFDQEPPVTIEQFKESTLESMRFFRDYLVDANQRRK